MRVVRGLCLGMLMLPFAGLLAGCDSLDTFQIWDSKKKLPGVRQDVFPGGAVPGVQQGIPPELVKGYQEPQAAVPDPATAAAETAEKAEPKPEVKPRPKPKPKVARTSPPRPQPVPQQAAPQQPQQAQAPWPAQQPQQPQQAQAPAPWPSAQPQAQQPAPWPGQR